MSKFQVDSTKKWTSGFDSPLKVNFRSIGGMKLFYGHLKIAISDKNISLPNINKNLEGIFPPDFNLHGENQCFLRKIAKFRPLEIMRTRKLTLCKGRQL